jgi:hypothetical protein
MIGAGVEGIGEAGGGTPSCKQIGRASVVDRFSSRSRLLFAVADGKSPLPKPLKGATLVAKPPVSGGFGLK